MTIREYKMLILNSLSKFTSSVEIRDPIIRSYKRGFYLAECLTIVKFALSASNFSFNEKSELLNWWDAKRAETFDSYPWD